MHAVDFRRCVESGDLDGIGHLLSDDVVFRSPTMEVPFTGKAAVLAVLHSVHEIFREFRYTDERVDQHHSPLLRRADRPRVGARSRLSLHGRGRIDRPVSRLHRTATRGSSTLAGHVPAAAPPGVCCRPLSLQPHARDQLWRQIMTNRQLVFLFPGQGAYFPGMLRDIWEDYPEIDNTFERIDAAVADAGGIACRPVLFDRPPSKIDDLLESSPDALQFGLYGTAIALFEIMRSRGIPSDVLLGHSFGEIAARPPPGHSPSRTAPASLKLGLRY